MKCERHTWDTEDREWCWRCEELTIQENKKKYDSELRDNSLQRAERDKEISTIPNTTQETGR